MNWHQLIDALMLLLLGRVVFSRLDIKLHITKK
jgi:hypothetical protein